MTTNRRSPAAPARRISRLRRFRRGAQLLGVAVRHLVRLPCHPRGRRLAVAARLAAQDAGPVFVKLGQLLATRPDLVPAAYAEELGALQSEVAPAPWPAVLARLAAELGTDPREVFADLSEEPLAAGSIAQVHAARLRGGAEVVVKVQRPGADAVVATDLDVLDRLARGAERVSRAARRSGIAALTAALAESVRTELDFTREAAATAALGSVAGADLVTGLTGLTRVAALAGRTGLAGPAAAGVRVARIHAELTTPRLLVAERLRGRPVARAAAVLDRYDRASRDRLAATLLRCVLRQVLVDGAFHGDPHPGNVLLCDDGTLALLDFGVVGRLDAATRAALGRLLAAVAVDAPGAFCAALLDLVTAPQDLDRARLAADVAALLPRHFAPGAEVGAEAFSALLALVTRHGLRPPPAVAVLFRALATLEGTLRVLAPGFDLVAAARAYATTTVLGELALRRVAGVVEISRTAARRLAGSRGRSAGPAAAPTAAVPGAAVPGAAAVPAVALAGLVTGLGTLCSLLTPR